MGVSYIFLYINKWDKSQKTKKRAKLEKYLIPLWKPKETDILKQFFFSKMTVKLEQREYFFYFAFHNLHVLICTYYHTISYISVHYLRSCRSRFWVNHLPELLVYVRRWQGIAPTGVIVISCCRSVLISHSESVTFYSSLSTLILVVC